jgi:hypothetical protein
MHICPYFCLGQDTFLLFARLGFQGLLKNVFVYRTNFFQICPWCCCLWMVFHSNCCFELFHGVFFDGFSIELLVFHGVSLHGFSLESWCFMVFLQMVCHLSSWCFISFLEMVFHLSCWCFMLLL